MSHSSNSIVRSSMVAACAAIIICIPTLVMSGCATTGGYAHTPSVVAHRGGAELAPENTLSSFATALQYDSDMVELDIHLSKDGVMMVTHDPLLKRVTGQAGSVSDYTAQELSSFDAAAKFKNGGHTFGFQKIPTLLEVIEFVEGHSLRPVQYQIEIKVKGDQSRYEGIEQKLIDLLHAQGTFERTIVISFDFPTLTLLRGMEPDLQLGALISKEYLSSIGAGGPEAVAKNMQALEVDFVGIKYLYLTQVLYDALRSRGLGVGVWTVNDSSNMSKFAKMGVDFITTNRPDLLKDVLSE